MNKIITIILVSALILPACDSSKKMNTETLESKVYTVAASTALQPDNQKNFIVAPNYRPESRVVFNSVLDLKQVATGFLPQLRGAKPAVSGEWPASLYATFSTPEGKAACTAALVGPLVMLTAAHCVPLDGFVDFTYQGITYNTKCTQSPRYLSNEDASSDYALCKLAKRFKEPIGFSFKYETIDTSNMSRLVNQSLILTGYGCISNIVKNNDADGIYRIGENIVDETSASAEKLRGPKFYNGKEDNNLFTIDSPDKANLCPGDSGGPAFRRSDNSNGGYTSRIIVGVNSRVFYRDASKTSYGSSLISATGGPDFRTWAEKWLGDEKIATCGIKSPGIPNIWNCRI